MLLRIIRFPSRVSFSERVGCGSVFVIDDHWVRDFELHLRWPVQPVVAVLGRRDEFDAPVFDKYDHVLPVVAVAWKFDFEVVVVDVDAPPVITFVAGRIHLVGLSDRLYDKTLQES